MAVERTSTYPGASSEPRTAPFGPSLLDAPVRAAIPHPVRTRSKWLIRGVCLSGAVSPVSPALALAGGAGGPGQVCRVLVLLAGAAGKRDFAAPGSATWQPGLPGLHRVRPCGGLRCRRAGWSRGSEPPAPCCFGHGPGWLLPRLLAVTAEQGSPLPGSAHSPLAASLRPILHVTPACGSGAASEQQTTKRRAR